MKHEYDVIIIGSGAGGGTVADRLIPLAKSGARIAILEAGPHYTHEHFTQREIEMMDLFWYGGAWPTEDGSVILIAGKAVGGSTLMYAGATFRLPEDVCQEWSVPGIVSEDLTPRFDRLEEEINVIDPDKDMVNDNNRLFKEACNKLGWPVKKMRFNLRNCEQEGFCNLGCSKGAKQGTMEVQLPKAIAAGIELVPNCKVERVSEGTIFAEVKPAPPGSHPGPLPAGKMEFKTKRIVLAAGSPGTPAILLRSGFQKKFPNLGRYITLHPTLAVYGIYPEPIKNYRGFPTIYYTPEFSMSHDYIMETQFYYPFVSTKHLGLWGRDLKDTMKRYCQLMATLILNHDSALPDNRIKVNRKGEIKLHYKINSKTIESLCHGQAQAARVFFAAGCEKVIMPCADRMIFRSDEIPDGKLEEFISPKNFILNKVPLSSAHPQGGCRMGTDQKDSVTNSWGQVHNHPWLYVADASLFPKSSHVNPYLTIMALADRVGENILERET